MRRFIIGAVLVFSAVCVFIVVTSSAASAHHVCVTAVVDPNTGTVVCTLLLDHDGDDDDSDSSSSTQDDEARWEAYHCHYQAAYQPGYEVETTTLNQIPPENYDEINSNPDVPGFRHLEEGTNYYNVLVHCGYPGAPPGGTIITLSDGELNPGPDPIALRTQALAKITVPEPPVAANPPHDQPDRFGLVNIPTWFWLEAGYWDPLTASATDPTGVMTVTVTATAQHADWDPGDGSAPIHCLDAGLEWSPGQPEDASACSHIYDQASAGQPGDDYSLEVSVLWEYTWTIDGAPQGPFGDTTLTTPFDYAVGEIQAVES